ncbi:hypothetical protein Ptr902_05611 [Pyrenophora tritici-repentis]|nr:hypothetical protein Ptr902_05611 [Pyrenophora tritici-repentis]
MSILFQPSNPSEEPYKSASIDTNMQKIHIPVGIVDRLRTVFEQKISEHQYERDGVYAERTMKALDKLDRNDMTYAEQLRNVEFITLFHLPENLATFIRDHDNFYRATLRCRKRVDEAKSGMTNMSTLTGVKYRIGSLRNSVLLDVLKEEPIDLMKEDPNVEQEFNDLAILFKLQMLTTLTQLDMLNQEIMHDTEMENVGSDHDINDFGQVVPSHRMRLRGKEEVSQERDHSVLCCICLAQYDGTKHTAFRLNVCDHIIGKPCMDAWLNSTSNNSTLCPHCRAHICTRRPRRPTISNATAEMLEDRTRLQTHIMRAVDLAAQASEVYFDVYSGSDEHDKANHVEFSDEDWKDKLIRQLNRRLATNQVNYMFLLMWNDVGSGLIWRLEETDVAFRELGA